MQTGKRIASLACGAVSLFSLAVVGVTVAPRATSAAPPGAKLYPASTVDLFGHGLGPAIGMGQWGDFGYAEQLHEPYTWIVEHFYGNTTVAHGGDPTISVALTENDGAWLVVTSASAFKVAGHSFKAGDAARVRPKAGSPGTFLVDSSTGCSASACCRNTHWTNDVASGKNPTAVPANLAESATRSQVIEICRADGLFEPVRGEVQEVFAGGEEHAVNLLPIDEYLFGVVPTEISYAWGTFGSPGAQQEPWGFQALEAQAVAARTYATAYYVADGGWDGYADVCDSADCQAYEGMLNENALSNRSVADTSGVILDVKGTPVPATTQFSSSTGGYTSGVSFPAVPDAGDAICVKSTDLTCNPYHDWTNDIPVTQVEATFPTVGALESVTVTKRNGLGDLGGRATDVLITGSKGSVTVTGDEIAADFGLLSDWFAVTNSGGDGGGGLHGYWLATTAGAVTQFGSAADDGSVTGSPGAPVVGMAGAPVGAGYWLTDKAGDIYAFGKADKHGSETGKHLNKPIVGIAAMPDGGGYWLVATDGGVFSFGDAKFYGSTGSLHLKAPIVGIAAAPNGQGYWLVASDGGIFSFGRTHFYGSTGSLRLNKPIVGMTEAPDGEGYWLVASDGGIFAFGHSRFHGSLGGTTIPAPVVAILATPDGLGYEIVTANGVVYPFGDAPAFGDGSAGGGSPPTVAMAGDP